MARALTVTVAALCLHVVSAAARDCVVTESPAFGWSTNKWTPLDTSACSAACTGGIQIKRRTVTVGPLDGGKACPGWVYVNASKTYKKSGTPDCEGYYHNTQGNTSAFDRGVSFKRGVVFAARHDRGHVVT